MSVNKGMPLKSSTVFLLVTAFICGVGVYVWTTSQDNPQEITEQRELEQQLFQFNEDDVTTLSIKTSKQTLVFEKTQQRFPHTWQMTKPQEKLADEAAVAFLLNLLATTKSPRMLSIEAARQKEFGFETSPEMVKVTLKNKQIHRLILGGQDPTESYIYALVDPQLGAGKNLRVVLVPTAFFSAINRPLTEWQAQKQPEQTSASPTPAVDPGPSIPLPPPQVPQ